MTIATSASGGYLAPIDATPQDADFEDQLQAVVVGITGIAGNLVRPRWQPKPPKLPDQATNWAAIGVISQKVATRAAVMHHPGDLDLGNGQTSHGYDELQQHEVVEIMASFYGPGSGGYAARFRDGLMIAQNREAMFLRNMALLDATDVVQAADLINEQWIRRFDLTFRVRRAITRIYPVENLLSAQGDLIGEDRITQPFDTNDHTN